jgi:tetrahydromethanopterin S-methyltransferase subunit C
MKDKLFALLMQAFSSRLGAVLQWLVGAAIGYAVGWLTQVGFAPPTELVEQLTVYLTGAGALLVSGWFNAYQAKQAQVLQTALEVVPDGWIGPVTIRRAEVVNAAEGVAP